MSREDQRFVRTGAVFSACAAGWVSYINYRNYVKKKFLRSHAHYRMSQEVVNITPWNSIVMTWYRMPKKEFQAYHFMRPYYIVGQLDYTKEILIPKKKYVNGQLEDGFDVINPVYCYDGGKLHFKKVLEQDADNMIQYERAGIVVNRGWVPYALRDKKHRQNETNSKKLVKMVGTWRESKDVHEYKVPNNPDDNEWNNLCVGDIANYWELPNAGEMKYHYFQITDKDNIGASVDHTTGEIHQWPMPITTDELVEDHYGWWFSQNYNKNMFQGLGAFSTLSTLMFFMS